jgi:hypothetical protein
VFNGLFLKSWQKDRVSKVSRNRGRRVYLFIGGKERVHNLIEGGGGLLCFT